MPVLDRVGFGGPLQGAEFCSDAMRLKCSADRLGVELPFHIIYGGGLMEPRPDMSRHCLGAHARDGIRLSVTG